MSKPLPISALPHVNKSASGLPFECVALLLQGGGALGAYQAGVYEAMVERGVQPDWVAGISIGAINAALIAGNPPEARVEKLRNFWDGITSNAWCPFSPPHGSFLAPGDAGRKWLNQAEAGLTLMRGVPGFFKPRFPGPWLHQDGTLGATSVYDTAELKSTLERLVDFDRINAGPLRLSVGAVNVRTGNFVYFDTKTHRIGPEHIMASGALPPGFPAVEIEGEHYWDGGLVSNTPLQWVIDSRPQLDTLAFQIDLWSARGDRPRTIAEVATRQKDIQFSSRTRAATEFIRYVQRLRHAMADLLAELPDELKTKPEAQLLQSVASHKVYNIVHLIYRAKSYEGDSKDYEFSRSSMKEHWRAGYHDAVRTLRHPNVLERPAAPEGVRTFDLASDGRE
ncbi:MAG TPA: patatin-like phospholipase family protein [Pseudolabrys sp.]|nr:patatin-like phospholipase family protein [Pseudolabrys sp.]